MKTLIVAPNYKNNDYYEFPLGLAYISGALKHAGYDTSCLNLNHYYEPLEILLEEHILGGDIDILMTGGLSPYYSQIENILNTARRIKPGLISIIGGGLVSSAPDLVCGELKTDFGVIGEGEDTSVALLNALSENGTISQVEGICFRDAGGKLHFTKPRPPIDNLDLLPQPDYDGFEIRRYLDEQMPNDSFYLYHDDTPRCFPIIASRSCPFSCTFCYHPLGKKYRKRSMDALFKEIDRLKEDYGVRTLALMDELFSDNRDRLVDFCERIKEYDLHWIAQLRVANVDDQVLRLMKESGCHQISYGLESANQQVLDSMKKKITVSQIGHALEATYKAEISIQGNYIFFDPAETVETAEETLSYWKRTPKYQISIFPIQVYPGTQLWDVANDQGIIDDPIAFLRQENLPPLNITKMSDFDFKRVNRVIHLLVEDYILRMPAPKTIDICKEGVGSRRKVTYKVSLTCPHCDRSSVYRRVRSDGIACFGAPSISCRHCNQRMMLPITRTFEHTRDLAKKVIPEKKGERHALLIGTSGAAGIYEARTFLLLSGLSSSNIHAVYGANPFGKDICIEGIPFLDTLRYLPAAHQDIDTLLIIGQEWSNSLEYHLGYLKDLDSNGVSIYTLDGHPKKLHQNTLAPKRDHQAILLQDVMHVRKVALFGAGMAGQQSLLYLAELGIEVISFLDSDSSKWGTTISGLPVDSPSLNSRGYDLIVVPAGPYEKEILGQLKKSGLRYGKDYLLSGDPILTAIARETAFEEIRQSIFSPLFLSDQ